MATPIFGAIGTAVGGPYLGYAAGLLGSYVDNRLLMPRLAGKGRQNALPPRLQDLPVGSNEAGNTKQQCEQESLHACGLLWLCRLC